MQPNKTLKYILDLESIFEELELVVLKCNNEYSSFSADFMAIRTVERDLEIIGEVIKKLSSENPEITITSAKKIIGLRNLIVHAYDAIDPSVLWKILLKDLPILIQEINSLKNKESF